jgi:hypothetical protein
MIRIIWQQIACDKIVLPLGAFGMARQVSRAI